MFDIKANLKKGINDARSEPFWSVYVTSAVSKQASCKELHIPGYAGEKKVLYGLKVNYIYSD